MTYELALEKNIVRETEKAVLATCYDIHSGYHDVWFPKSQIKISNMYIYIPEWLCRAKSRDMKKALGVIDADRAMEYEAA